MSGDLPPIDALRFLQLSHDLAVLAKPGHPSLLWVNASSEQLFGLPASELCAMPLLDLFHPADVPSVQAAMARLAQCGEVVRFRVRCRTSDAAYRWVEWNATQGDDALWYATGRDVTDTVHQTTQLRQREQLLSLAAQVSRTGHWIVELATETVTWSDEVYRIHGLSPDTFQPTLKTGVDAYHPDDREHVGACIARAVEERAPFEFELRLVRPDGSIRQVQSIGHPEVDPATGEVTHLFGVFRDITDDDRSRRYRELEQFAYVAAHDLRQPAGTVKSFVSLLLNSIEEPTDQQQLFASYIDNAAGRLVQLITDLRHYAESGARVEVTTVDAAECLADVLVDLRPDIEEAHGTIEVGELPRVRGNVTLLRQVFQNLLTNAVRFRSPDRALAIAVTATRLAGQVHISVSDNGIGFDSAQAERIFEPFRRLDTRTTGSGIGLAIAQRMVHQCEGELSAKGSPGEGAIFSIVLPAG